MYITLVKPKLQEHIRSAEYKIGLTRHLFELQFFFLLKPQLREQGIRGGSMH
jgi:hypothetical protein